MRDSHDIMTHFVKIVERYPEIYDRTLDSYRTRHVESAWEKVIDSVKTEINEECTVEELKVKWKGIRSSFSRYKNKLYQNNNDQNACKKYYLYDSLRFLDPFTICKGTQAQDGTFEENCTFVDIDETQGSGNYNDVDDWTNEVKPDVLNKTKKHSETDIIKLRLDNYQETNTTDDKAKKRKCSYRDNEPDDENEDLLFFKSILPDIRAFTNKQKRKLKVRILQLIDDLENERQVTD